MNRAERIVRLLEQAGREGVCLIDCPPEMRYTARNAIAEARQNWPGLRIAVRRCRKHYHASTVSRYFLEGAAYGRGDESHSDGSPLTQGAGANGPKPTPAPLFPFYDEPYQRRGNAK